jgi:hypothetical protein
MNTLRECAKLLWQILRELSDETAYQRHLTSHGVPSSPGEWRRFSDERLRAKYVRPKCC